MKTSTSRYSGIDRLNVTNSTVSVTILIDVAVTAERIVCQMWWLDIRGVARGGTWIEKKF